MSNWKRVSFGLALYVVLLAFAIVFIQTVTIYFDGSVPTRSLALSFLISILLLFLLAMLIIRWHEKRPLLIWLPAMLSLPLFISVLVGVCPRCDWSMKQVALAEGELAVIYQTAAFNGVSQVGAANSDGLWAADMANSQIVFLNVETNRWRQEIGVGRNPVGIALGQDSVWTADYSDGTVTRVNPADGAKEAVIDIGGKPLMVAVSEEAVWVTDQGRGLVSRINPRTNELEATIRLGFGPVGILDSPYGILTSLSQESQIVLIDPTTNKVARRLDSAYGTLNMALDGDDLWTVSPDRGYVQRFDLATWKKVADIQVDGEPTGVAVDNEYAWIVRSAKNDVVRIDVAHNELIGDPLPTGELPKTIVSDGRGGVWIMEEGAGKISHIVPSNSVQKRAEEPTESWFSSWISVTAFTTMIMAVTGSPIFLIIGMLFLTLVLVLYFRLESRHNGRVPVLWMALLVVLLTLPLLLIFFDAALAISTIAASMLAFIAVVRLTNRVEPEAEGVI